MWSLGDAPTAQQSGVFASSHGIRFGIQGLFEADEKYLSELQLFQQIPLALYI